MNGDYLVASVDRVGVDFNDDYASKGHEYFDVWAPEIATHYGEVFWTNQGDNPLPPHIVERFKDKVIAITGYEQDQVMVVPTGQPGVNPDQDVSVPINWAYNHHYMTWMTGTHSEMREIDISDPDELWKNHGNPKKMVTVDIPESVSGVKRKFADVAPTSQFYSEGNGGESRKSFHGYPDGFAQLIESPTSWHITPMQIDTRNRDCGSTYKDVNRCTNMSEHPSYEPRSARYGRNWQGVNKPSLPSNYSAILECPCNSRFGGDPIFGKEYADAQTKMVSHKFEAIPEGSCSLGQGITSAAECYSVAQSVGIAASTFNNQSISDPTFPAGCTVTAHADGTATTTFNAKGNAPCTRSLLHIGVATTDVNVTLKVSLQSSSKNNNIIMERQKKGEYCADNKVGVLKRFLAKSMSTADLTAALNLCEQFCLATASCTACSADKLNQNSIQFSAIPNCGAIYSWSGAIAGDVSLKTTMFAGNATITLNGPADAWFGVGFNAQNMADSPYTIYANSSGAYEQKNWHLWVRS
jgi:hypothetical protein